MKNYLITGGAGFIGSHLINKLIESSNIICVDNFSDYYDPQIKRNNIKDFLNKSNFNLYEADITDFDQLKHVFEANKIDCIINLAASVGVRPLPNQEKLYVQTNIDGTFNLLELAKEYGIKKFIQASSSSVYGERTDGPFNEEMKIDNPISLYAATKAAGEHLCYSYSHLHNINMVCLRFFTVYGPRQRPDMAIHKFARLIAENKPIQMYGDGTTKRDYTYVEDIIQGIIKSIEYDKTSFEIFNLGSSNTVELAYLISLIDKNLNIRAIVQQQPTQNGDVSITCADISKAQRLLEYAPQVSIEQGVESFINWFCKIEEKDVTKKM